MRNILLRALFFVLTVVASPVAASPARHSHLELGSATLMSLLPRESELKIGLELGVGMALPVGERTEIIMGIGCEFNSNFQLVPSTFLMLLSERSGHAALGGAMLGSLDFTSNGLLAVTLAAGPVIKAKLDQNVYLVLTPAALLEIVGKEQLVPGVLIRVEISFSLHPTRHK